MKKTYKLSIGVLVALLMIVLSATTIMAASNEKKLAANKWVTTKEDTYYKVTLKNDGCITLSASIASKKTWMAIDMYKKVKGKYVYVSMPVYTEKKSKTQKFAIEKGTYYFKVEGVKKIKYQFVKEPYKTNYCAGKAIELKKNKTIDIVNTPKNTYDRWYKIKLTKKQVLKYWVTDANGVTVDVVVYDSNMAPIDMIGDNKDYTLFRSREKLKKGTYYVCISGYLKDSAIENRATYTTFKWK